MTKTKKSFPNQVELTVRRLEKIRQALEINQKVVSSWGDSEHTEDLARSHELLLTEVGVATDAALALVRSGYKPPRRTASGAPAIAPGVRVAFKTKFLPEYQVAFPEPGVLDSLVIDRLATKGRVMVRTADSTRTIGFVPRVQLEVRQ